MPKINVHSNYRHHPKVERLKTYTNNEGDIYPIRLWLFCAEYFPDDGILRGYTEPEIERILGWNGIGGNLVRALTTVGFLDKKEEFYQVHDWREHAGFLKAYRINGKRHSVNLWNSRRKSLGHSERPSEAIEKNRIEKNKDIDVAPKDGSTPQSLFLKAFQETYQKETGHPFKTEKRHFVMTAKLIKDHSLESLTLKAKTLEVLCRDKSAWFTKDGWSTFQVEVLVKHWNAIIPPKKEKEFII